MLLIFGMSIQQNLFSAVLESQTKILDLAQTEHYTVAASEEGLFIYPRQLETNLTSLQFELIPIQASSLASGGGHTLGSCKWKLAHH